VARSADRDESYLGFPYWWDAAPPATREGALPARVDALIVGSGFTGLSAALTLARAGRSVLVCDAREIGYGASTRNGGHISAKMRRGLASLTQEHGEAAALAAWNVAGDARSYLQSLIEREHIDCDFTACQRFYGAHRPQDYAKLAQVAETLARKLGLEVSAVPAADQHRYVTTDAYHGGLLDRGTAAFHPAKYIRGLCEKVEAAGAVVRSNTRVTGVDRTKDGFAVTTARGRVSAGAVVMATNGYTGPEFPYFARRIISIGSYLIATEPLGKAKIDALMPGCDLVIDTRRAASYMRTSPDRTRILYGGRVAATEISATTSGPRLKAVLDNIFPSLRGTGVSHTWMGFTGFTFDELPHAGQHDGIWYAMGYCGTGTAMGTYLGHCVARCILGEATEASALQRFDFRTNPLYRGNPWFLSTLIAGYRLLDRMHL
jgi:glycine/D-amino acid oxidase-like deaminating enzyme